MHVGDMWIAASGVGGCVCSFYLEEHMIPKI
jgi:hypothetical protein